MAGDAGLHAGAGWAVALLLACVLFCSGCVCWRFDAGGNAGVRGAGVFVRFRPMPRVSAGYFEHVELSRQ